eukprot:3489058-Prymnesium_polylepis.1
MKGRRRDADEKRRSSGNMLLNEVCSCRWTTEPGRLHRRMADCQTADTRTTSLTRTGVLGSACGVDLTANRLSGRTPRKTHKALDVK